MAYVSLALFLVSVSALTLASLRGRRAVRSCCAPADPADDRRMRAAFENDDYWRRRRTSTSERAAAGGTSPVPA